ncbi:MAG: hypothetical protein ACHP7M_09990 [Burkholderiales bacterium]
MADDPHKTLPPDPDRKVISLNERYESQNRAKPVAPQMLAPAVSGPDTLRTTLDTLLVAQFELCGVEPHPTRASLSEMRFRQACEALATGIALLRKLTADTKSATAIGSSSRHRSNDVQAAD